MAARRNDKKNAKERVMERVKGIEPSRPAWKAGALPLSYTRLRPRPIASSATPTRAPTIRTGGWRAHSRSGGDRESETLDRESARIDPPERPHGHGAFWWAEQDSNLRRLSHQIYSLARLAASVSARTVLASLTPAVRSLACRPASHLLAAPRAAASGYALELAMGLEPTTSRLQIRCSTG
jgi:hypothetical protein